MHYYRPTKTVYQDVFYKDNWGQTMVKKMESSLQKWKQLKEDWYTYQEIADLEQVWLHIVYNLLKSRDFKTIVSLYDIHIPYQIDLSSVLKFIKEVKPDEIIFWWDAIDCAGVSRFYKGTPEVWLTETLEEITLLRWLIKDIKDISWASKIVYLKWNHEQRLDDKIKEQPELNDVLNLEDNLSELVNEVHDYNKYYQVWNLYYIHWTYHNDAHAKKHALSYQRSVRYWHLHTCQQYCASTPINNEVVDSKSIPCLCERDPDYMKNRPSPWINWFNVAYVNEDWTFNDYTITIDKGSFIFNWKRYE